MIKKIVSLSIALFLVCVLIFSMSSGYAATNMSSVFPNTDDSKLDETFQAYYVYICNLLNRQKNDNVKQTFGSIYLKNGFIYYNEQEKLFYVKIIYDYTDTPSSTTITKIDPYDFYFEITADKNLNQLKEPKQPISNDDWIEINSYSELDCYKTAEKYFNNQRWNNPSSIKIYGYTVQYGPGTYIYYIDYSGQNSYGGSTRNTFIIEIDAATNEVIWGASTN